MSVYSSVAIILSLAVLVSYVNHCFIKMHSTIAMMTAALSVSIILSVLNLFGLHHLHQEVTAVIRDIPFHKLVMQFMLGFLLFAGALTVDLTHLRKQKWEIALLSCVSTIISAFLIAGAVYYLLRFFNINLAFIYCLLFGSLISPTDPIAVLAIFKQVGAPKTLETAVTAEALFNDGVGVVLFLTAYHVAFSHGVTTTSSVLWLFFREAIGGIVYGLILGLITCWLIKPIKDFKLEMMLTIALVLGAYTFAQTLFISGPLAMVVAGIMVANYRRQETMNSESRRYLENTWEMIDEMLNMLLFLLLGFEILVIHFTLIEIMIALAIIPIVLFVRFLTVALPMNLLRPWRHVIPHSISILTWGGLRGGLAVALAFSLPITGGGARSWLLAFTYAVVVFSILVQGTTIKGLVKRARGQA
jgi:monovalent cation:H+ antiporter, CPA1 family